MKTLTQEKSDRRSASARRKIAGYLLGLSQMVASNDLTTKPYGVVVSFVSTDEDGEAESRAYWAGEKLTIDDIREAIRGIEDELAAQRKDYGHVSDQKARRKKWRQEQRQKVEDYYKQHPFQCDHAFCKDRFATEKGKQIHMRSCPYVTGQITILPEDYERLRLREQMIAEKVVTLRKDAR